MKARVIAWNGPAVEFRNDIEFKAVNNYKCGPIKEIEGINTAVAEEMEEEFDLLYPEFDYNHMQLVTEKDGWFWW